jgi:hypothetical protein
MKRAILLTVFTATMTTLATAQQPTSAESRMAIEIAAQAGGMAQVALETRVTRGAPYSGEAVTEFVQTLADGNRIVRRSTTRVYRDGEGRTRRETVSEAAGGGEMNSVIITDPVAGSSLILDPANRTALRAPAMFAKVDGGNIAVAGGMRQYSSARIAGGDPAGEAAATTRIVVPEAAGERSMTFRATNERVARGAEAKEDLGQQTIEGVLANGTRMTTTIPAGAVGNEQPITIVSEQWFSPELGVLVLTRHSDPRVGETSYRLTNIVRAEPDRALFQAPADYTVKEPAMLRRSPVPPPPPPPPQPPSAE